MRSVLVLLVDRGPDFNCIHGMNKFYYGRYFKDMNLDKLIEISYCHGDTAFNYVEHLWAQCSVHSCTHLPSTKEQGLPCPASLDGLSQHFVLDLLTWHDDFSFGKNREQMDSQLIGQTSRDFSPAFCKQVSYTYWLIER